MMNQFLVIRKKDFFVFFGRPVLRPGHNNLLWFFDFKPQHVVFVVKTAIFKYLLTEISIFHYMNIAKNNKSRKK